MSNKVSFADFKGKVFVDIQVDGDEIKFITKDGKSFEMYHQQDCCENVTIESIVGDIKDLLGNPILLAEEVSGGVEEIKDDDVRYNKDYQGYNTYTFYKLATIKGYVDIRWYGESNGYYSERVDLFKGRDYTLNEVEEMIQKNNIDKKLQKQKIKNRL